MRRMLPQKLIDYIKELKNRIDILDIDSIELLGSVHSAGFYVNDTNMSFTDEGVILNDGSSFSVLGEGLVAEDNALKLEAPIWKKINGVLKRTDAGDGHFNFVVELPHKTGTIILIRFTDPYLQTQREFVVTYFDTISAYEDGQGMNIVSGTLNASDPDETCALEFGDDYIQNVSVNIPCEIIYQDFYGKYADF